MGKKQVCPEFENHERWLVAFGDMMTLLFALFVVLYALANVEMEKLKKVSSSIQKAFGMSTPSEGEEGVPAKGRDRREGVTPYQKGNAQRERISKRLSQSAEGQINSDMAQMEQQVGALTQGRDLSDPNGLADNDRIVFLNRDTDGIRVTLLSRGIFEPNQVYIDAKGKKILAGIAKVIRGKGAQYRVEGHTDNNAFTLNGMTNWELSSQRAVSVLRYLVEGQSFDPKSIYAAGYADTRPIADNGTQEGRSKNRRVDIKIVYDNEEQTNFSDEGAPPSVATPADEPPPE